MKYPDTKTKPWQHQIDFWQFAKDKPAAYAAFEMGCVSGDTTVQMLRASIGKKVTVKHLYELFNCIKNLSSTFLNICTYLYLR